MEEFREISLSSTVFNLFFLRVKIIAKTKIAIINNKAPIAEMVAMVTSDIGLDDLSFSMLAKSWFVVTKDSLRPKTKVLAGIFGGKTYLW